MTTEIDLPAYLRRVGYHDEARATLETLERLHALHAAAIPFENLSAFIGEPIPLDPASLQRKLVDSGRGGWCFEQNLLFAHVLRAIGFDLATLAARVRWNAPADAPRPRTHMLLSVRLPEGEYLADVGFGGLTLTAPLRLDTGEPQETPHERFRLVERAFDVRLLEAEIAGEWQPLYSFDLQPQDLSDYEMSNWYLANHPASHFLAGVIAARSEPGARHAVRSGRYALHRRGAPSEFQPLESVADYRRVLSGPLAIRLPDTPELDRRLEALLKAKPAA